MNLFNHDNQSNYIDRLTSLPNKNYYIDNLYPITLQMIKDVKKGGVWSIMFCDINGLKLVNDIYGHVEGDRIIKKTANILKECIRINRELPDSIVQTNSESAKNKNGGAIHLGGDEFLVILPKCNKNGAELIKKRIYNKIAEKNKALKGASLSIGIADTLDVPLKNDINIYDAKSVLAYIKEIVHLADKNMYEEKNNLNFMTKDELLNYRLKCINRLGNQIGIDFTLEESYLILDSIESVEQKRKRMK